LPERRTKLGDVVLLPFQRSHPLLHRIDTLLQCLNLRVVLLHQAMHSLDRGERDAVGILETDRLVAVPPAEC